MYPFNTKLKNTFLHSFLHLYNVLNGVTWGHTLYPAFEKNSLLTFYLSLSVYYVLRDVRSHISFGPHTTQQVSRPKMRTLSLES